MDFSKKEKLAKHWAFFFMVGGSSAQFSSVQFSRSVVSDSLRPHGLARQAPLSMGFSRQEDWSGLPFPYPGDLPNPGIEPGSPALQADALSSEPQINLTLESLLKKSL